jgi:hypothetical protein
VNWEVLILRLADPADPSWSLESAARVPLGVAAEVKRALVGVFGEGDWNLDKGLFDHEGYSCQASIGIGDLVDTMTLEYWRSGDPLPSVRALCDANGWQAWDLGLWRPVTFDQKPTSLDD